MNTRFSNLLHISTSKFALLVAVLSEAAAAREEVLLCLLLLLLVLLFVANAGLAFLLDGCFADADADDEKDDGIMRIASPLLSLPLALLPLRPEDDDEVDVKRLFPSS